MAGLVEKSGSWYSYKDNRLGQGKEAARTFLKENPSIADEIEQAIRANAGLVAETLTGENSPTESKEIEEEVATVEE